MGVGKYLKKAFLNHWNLLIFLGGMGFAALSGQPDVYMPLVMAGEVAYVGLVGTHPKFQRAVDIQEWQANKQDGSVLAAEAFERLRRMLPARQLKRFEDLRDRCAALRQIAHQMKATESVSPTHDEPFDNLQLSGLDRLLWIYLRLLYTQTMLDRFFERTREDQIRGEIKRLEDRIARMPADPSPSRQGVLKALQDSLETSHDRLANFQKARDNYELVEAEIERLESKIQSITEMAINRQDPQFVSGQVDQVAGSLVQTEKTINDLQFATGLDPLDLDAPSIMPRQAPPIESATPQPEPPPRPRTRQTDDGIHYY